MSHLTRVALEMLQEDPDLLEDAKVGAPIGNSVLGSLLSLTYKSPRWATEDAVCEALQELDGELGPRLP